MTDRRRVDPVTLAVLSGAFTAVVKEMTVIVQRTARSPLLAIGNDFSNAIYTMANGFPEMIIQGDDQPVHLGSMLATVKNVATFYDCDLKPGDIIIRNEPRTGGGHLDDVDVIQPIFENDELMAWACSRAHMGDLGGPVPGGYNPNARDVFSEGIVCLP